MDVLYRLAGLEFVWNIHKATTNLEKHGIRFEQACEVFFDPLSRVFDAGIEEEVATLLWAKPRTDGCSSWSTSNGMEKRFASSQRV